MAKHSNLFGFSDFRDYLKLRLEEAGRGSLSKWASQIGVHSSLFSQVLQGSRTFTPEQAFDLSAALDLTPLQTEYFQKLISWDRAGNSRYREHLQAEIEALRKKALNLSERFEHEKSLSETQQARFYSHRMYSAIRLFCSIDDDGASFNEIAEAFRLDRMKAQEIVDFLVQAGLIVEKNGKYVMGTQRTFLSRTSPFLPQHHTNWRVGALQRLPRLSEEEMMFTCPMSIGVEDFGKLREMLSEIITKSSTLIKDSKAEKVACMNLDLFWVNED